MSSRRTFLGQVASSLGTLAMPGTTVLGANERVRVGVIGYGDRGSELAASVIACPHTEVAAIADIYTAHLERAKQRVPGSRVHLDHRALLDDKTIDAVLVATPQHLHCEHFTDSIQAGKHVYQEKTMAFTVEHAKRMRAAYLAVEGKQTVQIGHQNCSFGQAKDAQRFLSHGQVGEITAIDATMYRNTPTGKPQWSRPVYPDMTPDQISWDRFLGGAAKIPFDANRYRNWRFFWDYSGGGVYENLCHQLAFWYKALLLPIPNAVTMNGGLYLWQDGREVPDTMNVAMEHDTLLFTWTSGFGNASPGVSESVLGDNGSIFRSNTQIRYTPEKVNRPRSEALTGATPTPPHAHMQNFFDCIRTGQETNCPFDLGFKVSVTCRMAVESYRHKRTMRWDSQKEEIV